MSKWLKQHGENKVIFTVGSCELEPYLKAKKARYEIMGGIQDGNHPYDPEYALTEKFYGDRVTDRTGCHMMNHVDEGMHLCTSAARGFRFRDSELHR